MTTDLLGSLKTYLTKLSDGEKTPQEVAAAINSWARESADSLKTKIHEEVEAAALKLGFVKREEFDRLVARVDAIAPIKKSAPQKSAPVKKASPKKSTAKKAPAKKSAPKKSAAKKSGVKK
jgi:BMFP domain-containing protein YqiC